MLYCYTVCYLQATSYYHSAVFSPAGNLPFLSVTRLTESRFISPANNLPFLCHQVTYSCFISPADTYLFFLPPGYLELSSHLQATTFSFCHQVTRELFHLTHGQTTFSLCHQVTTALLHFFAQLLNHAVNVIVQDNGAHL